MSNILEDIKARITEIESQPKDTITEQKIRLIKSHMKDQIPFEKLDARTIFGILEFLGYDENNIIEAYSKLISEISIPKQYVIENEGEEVK